MPLDPVAVDAKARAVRLLLFDVDGVLTDGTVLMHADGSESKRFAIRDGTAIVAAHRTGLVTGLLSGRRSASTAVRAAQLGIRIVHEAVTAKLSTYEQILRAEGLTDAQVAYMGDDLVDMPVLSRVGLSAAPADAATEVLNCVDHVTAARGGAGAVRELVELVLRAQGKWETAVNSYVNGDSR